MFANFTSRSFGRATPTLVFNLRYFCSPEDILQFLPLQNPMILTSPNILLYSLSGVKRRCILVIMFFNWAKEGWYEILMTGFGSLSFFPCFFNSSLLENFIAFKICFRTNLSLNLPCVSYISRPVQRLSKNEVSEQTLFSLNVWL